MFSDTNAKSIRDKYTKLKTSDIKLILRAVHQQTGDSPAIAGTQ